MGRDKSEEDWEVQHAMNDASDRASESDPHDAKVINVVIAEVQWQAATERAQGQ